MGDNVRKGVALVLNNGAVLYNDNQFDKHHHDDILWDMLSEERILPDSYKRLASKDDKLAHESSSLGLEGMLAASNGMIVMYLVYDNNIKYNHAIIYLPEVLTQEQHKSFIDFLNTMLVKEPVNDYYVGTVNKGKTYDEVDNLEYRPDYTDEFMFGSLDDFINYIKNYNNNLHR